MILERTLVVFDLETTGTWIEKDKIIEIAMIKIKPDQSQEVYHQKVNPCMPIPAIVTEITGISEQDVESAPKFKDIVTDVLEFIGDADFGGFNVERFDLPLLEREIQETGNEFKWRTRNIYDAQKVFHLNQKRDLTAAYQFYCQKDLVDAHSALADTQATLDILSAQVNTYGKENQSIDVLKEFDYKQTSEFYDSDRRFRWWNGKLYMMFGKYARKLSLDDVVKRDRRYLEWILSADFSEEVKILVEDALAGKMPTYNSGSTEANTEEDQTQLDLFG